MTEHWKPIPGFEGRYEASTHGRVRSLTRRGRPGRILAIHWQGTHGTYPYVSLSDGTKTRNGRSLRRKFRLNRLVLWVFVGPPPTYDAHAAHKSDDRANCRLDNLEWQTPLDNYLERLDRWDEQLADCRRRAFAETCPF